MVVTGRSHAARVEALRAHVRAQRAEGNRLREALRSAKLSRALALELLREGAPRRLRLLPWVAAIAAAHFAIVAVFFAFVGCVRRGAVPSSFGLVAVVLSLVASLLASRPGAGGRARPVLRRAATTASILAAVVLLTLAGRHG